MPAKPNVRESIVRAAADAREELVGLTQALVRFPTVNPPGEAYEPCARFLGEYLAARGYQTDLVVATDRAEHSSAHPRVNIVGSLRGESGRPNVHLNGHIDVVPVGHDWSLDPFAGVVREGKIYGRGVADMKGGLAAAVIAVECIRRAGVRIPGTVEVSGTVDEETGGWAGVAHLARSGRLTSARVDHVIIPEPLNVDRICIGHRGVWWADVIIRGRIAHGSMPSLGVSAIATMGDVIHALQHELAAHLGERVTAMPVVPDASRRATLNFNTVAGGQVGYDVQSPCVADECRLIIDRRFLAEESLGAVRAEIVRVLDRVTARNPGSSWELVDRLVVDPVQTPASSPLIPALQRSIREVIGREAALVASPGTYDHKHVTRIGGITSCVAYGPGVLEVSHQPDEWLDIDDLVHATQVLALTVAELTGALA